MRHNDKGVINHAPTRNESMKQNVTPINESHEPPAEPPVGAQFIAPSERDLPEGWVWKTMGEISDVIGGGTPRTNVPEYYKGGNIPWITPADLSGYTNKYISHGSRFITERGLKNSSARLMPASTVLFTSRAPIGYVTIAKNPISTNQGFKSFVLIDGILPDYIYWYLKGNKNLAESLASGTTFLELSGAKAKQIPVPLAPLDQQKRIVAEIEKQFSRLDEAVAALKRIQANLKRYKASVLKAAVEGKLTEQWRKEHPDVEPASELLKRILAERCKKWEQEYIKKYVGAHGHAPKDDLWKKKYKEPTPPDTTNLPILPKGWVWATVEQINNRPCAYGVLQPGPDVSNGVPLVRVGDINDGRVEIANLKKISNKIADKYPRTNLRGDEVLITLVGAIGRTAVVPKSLAGANTARAVGVIPLTDLVNSRWVEIWFRNPSKIADMTSKAHEVARKTLNLEDVRVAPIVLPPEAEQSLIVDEVERLLSFVEEVEVAIDSNLKRADRLRQSILKQAFSGRLISQSQLRERASA